MFNLLRDKNYPLTRKSYLLMWALVLTSLGFWRSGTDPVNIPKLVLLGAFSGLILGNLIVEKLYQGNKLILALSTFFLLSLITPMIFSSAPLVQQLYGVSGRNTGFLAYLFLAILFIGAAALPRESDYQFFPRAILLAGFGSAFVCTLEILGFNPLGVTNPFGAIIGTFGNPNFISAFSAMVTVGAFAFSFNPALNVGNRLVFIFLSLVSLFMVLKSQSFQGLGTSFFGLYLVLLFLLFYKKLWLFFFGLLSSGLIGVALIRIEYWQAGLRMFFSHPFTGIGLNSYGDWYRFTRDPDALEAPMGGATTTVAHNVYIDFAAGGGILLLISFTLLFGATFYHMIKALRKLQNYDPLFISLLVVWMVYLATAFFSIDQLGLAIWGWIIGGAIIGVSRNITERPESLSDLAKVRLRSDELKSAQRNSTNALVPQFILFFFFLGSVVPALKGDSDYLKARSMGQAQILVDQVAKWPQDQVRYSEAVYLLLRNGFESEALSLTVDGLRLFPRASNLWQFMYSNPRATDDDRNRARERLRELDPLNPLVLELKKI
jgi:O-antigen ligase